MTQPTQDTDITSSISPMCHIRDNDLNEQMRTGERVKKLAQGQPPTSFIMETEYSDNQKSDINGSMATCKGSELVKSLGENSPWLIKFSKVIQSAVGSKNPKFLDRLLFVYVENMSRDVNTCYTKPYRAAKLKTHINETLIFFHLYWRNIKERVDDHNQYLDKMSEILGMYVDMELKASRRGKDSASKIAAKLLTAMFIYLDNSEEHIFRIMFRVKFITKNYSQICSPIFTKLFSGLSGGIKCITDLTYVRYLLALKLWKRIKDDLQEKKKINELALNILGQRTPLMNSELAKIIPKPPECHKNGTLWLLQPNSFDLRQACDAFIAYELNERIISLPDSIERLKIIDSVDPPSTQISLESIDRLQEEDKPEANKPVDGVQQVKKVLKIRRFKPSFPKLRPGEVLFIDLTAENEENKLGNGKKKKKREKKKLKWLKDVSKRSKLKKERKGTDKTWIETSDVHSTENTGAGIERMTNNWPISEDKITESTQRIQSIPQNVHRFGKRAVKLNTDNCVKNKCDTTCPGCKFCSSIGKLKYTSTERQGEIESSEDLVSSQSTLLNNDLMVSRSGGGFVNHIKQEPKNSAAHGTTIISESHETYYVMDQLERNAALKMMKQEPQDIIDDSTTDKKCDKIILTDSSSFNFTKEIDKEHFGKRSVSSPVVKLKAGDTTVDNATIPLTSSSKNILHSSATRDKLCKIKECRNETCVVSTTATICDVSSEEQINVISGSTNESNVRRADFSSDNIEESCKKEAVANSRKLFPASKVYKSFEMSKNCYKDVSGDSVNNKLQHSLIHALSLDEIIEIGRDDVDSQSEDEEKKGYSNKTMHQSFRNKLIPSHDDNDFFQIPDIQLCDDLTNDNELVTAGGKSKVDEFENIDILDSILNGDMSMQDILEEQQHLSMNSVSNDTSNNMLGFFTEFFKQSEVTLPAKKDCASNETLYLDEVSKSLPEGSLGMTGILNSLLDSDLTSIDSPPSDFMYSNVQTVDPRLIRKSPTAERTAFLSDFSTVSDIFSQKEQSSVDNYGVVDSLSKKTKDQLFLDERESLNCTDLEEFGLNSSKETTFEMPVLEEELIQLPQHPLIDETIITQISPSISPDRSEMVNLTESKSALPACIDSQDFINVQLPENNYEYSKLGNFQEFTSFRFKDIIQHPANGIDHCEDLPTSTLTDFTPPQSVDPPQSPYTFASSPAPAQVHSQTIPHSPTHSIGTSRHIVSANMLTPPPSVPQLIRQNNLTPPPTPQHNQNCNEATSQQKPQGANTVNRNYQKGRIRCLSMNSQVIEDNSFLLQDSISSVQKKENCKTIRRKSQAKVTCLTRNKQSARVKATPTKIENERTVRADQEQSVRLAQVQVALTRLTSKEIIARASGEQSVLKSNILVNRETDFPLNSLMPQPTVVKTAQRQLQTPQLQRIDFRDFGIAAQQKKPVFINLNGKTKPALVFERNTQQCDKLMKTLHGDVNSRSNIVYKLTSNVKPATSKDKPYSKLPKVNFTLQNERDIIGIPQSTITRCGSNVETMKESQKVIRPRCSTRRVKAQANKPVKESNARKTFTVPTTEEPSLKKRKITSKFLPLLENEGIIYAVNPQKAQEKHSNIIRKDFARKDKTKKKVV